MALPLALALLPPPAMELPLERGALALCQAVAREAFSRAAWGCRCWGRCGVGGGVALTVLLLALLLP
jgi:hypothetical protein